MFRALPDSQIRHLHGGGQIASAAATSQTAPSSGRINWCSFCTGLDWKMEQTAEEDEWKGERQRGDYDENNTRGGDGNLSTEW